LEQNSSIKSVSFVGSGNVATHLAIALSDADVKIIEVFSQNPVNANKFAMDFNCTAVDSMQNFSAKAQLLIISVPDSKIKDVANELSYLQTLIVHTSGITGIEALSLNKKYGVFYPLQTFSKKRIIDMKDVPFCIEAKSETELNLLMNLALKISNNVKNVSSEQRKILHLMAVMVSNFSNHLYHLAHDILATNNLSFDFLIPLINETALKIKDVHPSDAQTGPARRKDVSTIDEHMKMLNAFPEYKEIYRLLSEQIMKKYHE